MFEDTIKCSFIFLLENKFLNHFLVLFRTTALGRDNLEQWWVLYLIVPVTVKYGPWIWDLVACPLEALVFVFWKIECYHIRWYLTRVGVGWRGALIRVNCNIKLKPKNALFIITGKALDLGCLWGLWWITCSYLQGCNRSGKGETTTSLHNLLCRHAWAPK